MYTYPNPRRLGKQHQSDKSWHKQGNMLEQLLRHAMKQEHARKRNKAFYGKQIDML